MMAIWIAPPSTGIFIDYSDPNAREYVSGPRFVVLRLEADGTHPIVPDDEPLLVTDDWTALTEFVKARLG